VTKQSDKLIAKYDIAERTLRHLDEALASRGFSREITGVPDSIIETGIVAEESIGELRAFFDAINSGEAYAKALLLIKSKDDGFRSFRVEAEAVVSEAAEPASAIITYSDVTLQREEAVYEKWRQSLALLPTEQIAILEVNLSSDLYRNMEGGLIERYFDSRTMKFDERMKDFVQRRVYPEDVDKFMTVVNRERLIYGFYDGIKAITIAFRATGDDMELRWLSLTMQLAEYPDSTDIKLYMIFQDIDKQKRGELLLRERSEIDPLTKVLNRAAFIERVESAIAEKPESRHAFIIIDIDHFKKVNDLFGHVVGDKALFEIVQDLKSALRQDDLLGRLGGDEFVIFLRNMPPCDTVVEKRAEQICTLMRHRIEGKIEISGSLGIALYPRDGSVFSDLYDCADAALYQTKGHGRGGFSFYRHGMKHAGSVLYGLKGMSESCEWDSSACKEQLTLPADDAEFGEEILAELSRLHYVSEYDSLTGFYNRTTFLKKAEELISAEPRDSFIVAYFDIDGFKAVNDLYGYAEGDRLLLKIAESVRRALGDTGIYSRITADKFAMVVPNDAAVLQLFSCSRDGGQMECGLPFEVKTSMGLYIVDDPTLRAEAMLDRAALAEKTVKGRFDRLYAYYDHEMLEALLREQEIVSEMESALESGQFDIYFQPQYNNITGRISGAEVLVRWMHPTKGIIYPNDFIPIFEKNGFISRLDEFVWERACSCLKKWNSAGWNSIPISVSVNVSRHDIFQSDLVEKLKSLIKKYELPTFMLKLEITETAFVEDSKRLIDVVKRLQKEGFFIEMDDFGSGYSSLNALKNVPVDILKLDMSFLTDDEGTGRGGNILNSIMRMAKWLRLPVVAEGVETKEQADYLRSIGCDYVQGYYYSQPMSVPEFERLIKSAATEIPTIDSHILNVFDVNAFWDPNSQETITFNSYVGGAAVIEYHDGICEVLRINDRYLDVIGMEKTVFESKMLDLFNTIEQSDRKIFVAMLERAISGDGEAECETRRIYTSDGNIHWIKSRVRLIAYIEHRYIFYSSVENITERIHTAQALKLQEERYGALMKLTDAMILEYDVKKDILFCDIREKGEKRAEKTVEHVLKNKDKTAFFDNKSAEMFYELLQRACEKEMSGTLDVTANICGSNFEKYRAVFVSIADESGNVCRVIGRADRVD